MSLAMVMATQKARVRALLRCAIAFVIFAVSGCGAFAQSTNRPAFCEAVPDALLGGLAAPYSEHVAPNGDVYCEGLLRNAIALPPTMVISVKQYQAEAPRFVAGGIASLTWCDDSDEAVHVRLRSLKLPAFGLDAMHKNRFEWRTDLISKWQPDWGNIGALVIRESAVEKRNYKVLIPIRSGPGYSSTYSFVVQSRTPIHLTTALIEPQEPPGQPQAFKVDFIGGPAKDTWTTAVPFGRMKPGIYRITFEEETDQAGNTAEPIYILHKACGTP